MAISYYYMVLRRRWYEGDLQQFLGSFLGPGVDGYGPWHGHVESWLDSPLRESGSLLVLRYEDLLEDPVPHLRSAMEFLGTPVAREQAEAAARAHSAERMRERERQSRFHQKQKRRDIMFVRTAGSGDWARTFTAEDKERFARIAGDVLRRLGYAPPP